MTDRPGVGDGDGDGDGGANRWGRRAGADLGVEPGVSTRPSTARGGFLVPSGVGDAIDLAASGVRGR